VYVFGGLIRKRNLTNLCSMALVFMDLQSSTNFPGSNWHLKLYAYISNYIVFSYV
jgi:hypothetical protein